MIVSTRPPTLDDLDFTRQTHHAAYRDVVERQYGPWNESAQDGYFQSGWQQCAHEIILVDGQPCGYTAVIMQSDAFELYELVVHPNWQNKGIGSIILERLKDCSLRRELPVKLRTHIMNHAREFYRKHGFRECGKDQTHVYMEWKPQRPTGN